MARPAFIVVALLALSAAGVVGYSLRSDRKSPTAAELANESGEKSLAPPPASLSEHSASDPESVASPLQVDDAGSPQPGSAQVASAETLAKWIADASSDDSKARAAAIVALAGAPKSQAVPVMERILQVGEPQVDRQIALRSLHTLAVQQGDADGRIRDVLRQAIYHGDDEGVSQSAQALLEDIEVASAEAGASLTR